jgi:lipopolysaccharide exporter
MTKNNSYWISSGKFTLLERLTLLSTGIINFYLLVRVMNKEDYGIWIFFLTVTTLLDTARNGFFQNPLIRFLNNGDETPEQKIKIQYTSFLLNLGLSTAFSALLLLIMYPVSLAWKNSELFKLFLIYLGTNIVHSFLFHFEYILKANFRFKGSFLAVLVRGISLIIIIAYYFITKTHLPIWLLAVYYSISAFFGVIISYFFVRDIFKISRNYDRIWAKQLFGYGSYTLGSNISAVMLRYIDTWMIAFFISPVAVALYNVAIRIANLFEVPSMAIASMLFPKAVQEAKEKGEAAFKELYEKSVAVIILLVFPFVILVISFSDQIIYLLAGKEYMETANILKVTMLYGLIIPLNKQMGILLEAIGKAKKNMLFVARNAAINFILNTIAIPLYGTIGAAYATLTTMLIAAILNQIYMAKNFNVEFLSLPRYLKVYSFMIINRLKSLSTGVDK